MKTEYLKIGDFSEVFDGPHATPTKTDEGPYYLSISSLENGNLELSRSAHLSAKDFDKWTKRVVPRKGDLLFSYETRLGEAALMPDGIQACLGRRMGILRPDTSKITSEFLLYSYLSPEFQNIIKANTITGATVDRISLTDLPTYSMRVPELKEQEDIVAVLSTLDARIKLNKCVNTELEAMTKLLYDYWFVQFDFPISAEQASAIGKPELEGKPYRASGGKMVYNEKLKREIPVGWQDGSLVDVAIFTNGIACQKYPADGGETLGVIKIREMRSGLTPDSDLVSANVPEKVKIKNGDILFSWSASLEVMIWAGGEGALNQHIFKVTSDTHPRSFCYFVLLDYLRHFRMMANLRKTTMGHITIDHLEQSQIAIPSDDVAEAFEVATKPIIDRMVRSQEETQELSKLRDWLLPMLMNGQVTVSP